MVLLVTKYSIHPDKVDAFQKWVEGAIKRNLAVPGVIELRAYRTMAGDSQIVTTMEFADLTAWAAWVGNEQSQQVFAGLYALALNVTTELWGPLPAVPAPIRPGK